MGKLSGFNKGDEVQFLRGSQKVGTVVEVLDATMPHLVAVQWPGGFPAEVVHADKLIKLVTVTMPEVLS